MASACSMSTSTSSTRPANAATSSASKNRVRSIGLDDVSGRSGAARRAAPAQIGERHRVLTSRCWSDRSAASAALRAIGPGRVERQGETRRCPAHERRLRASARPDHAAVRRRDADRAARVGAQRQQGDARRRRRAEPAEDPPVREWSHGLSVLPKGTARCRTPSSDVEVLATTVPPAAHGGDHRCIGRRHAVGQPAAIRPWW